MFGVVEPLDDERKELCRPEMEEREPFARGAGIKRVFTAHCTDKNERTYT